MSLIGKFFYHCGEDCGHSGEVVEQVADDVVLVRLDKCERIPTSMIAIRVSAMLSTLDSESDDDVWEFFATRAELDAWVDWLGEPPEDHPQLVVGATIN